VREREGAANELRGKRPYSVWNENLDGQFDGRVSSPLDIRIEQVGQMTNPEREIRRMATTQRSRRSTDLNGQD
jgi:hypothetical protein